MKPFVKSEPVPEVNDEPVKVIVRDSLDDLVLKSGKNGPYTTLLTLFPRSLHHCPLETHFYNPENVVSFEKHMLYFTP